MDKNKKILICKMVAVLSVVPALMYAYMEGPDPRKTGAPGDSTCAQATCHVGTAGTGNVRIVMGGRLELHAGRR